MVLTASQSSDEALGAEADRTAGRQAGLVLRLGDRPARFVFREEARVQGDAGDAGRPREQRGTLVEVDQLPERRNREAFVVGDVALTRLVAEDEQMRRGAVVQTERHARVLRVEQRALALDDQQL